MTLEKFLQAKINSITRERIFYNKVYFDLKLAAARSNYPLSIFEPEVDRDKFDIVLDDGDIERRIQLKTKVKSARTTTWYSNKRFLRPDLAYGTRFGFAPADCGLGGGFILIEIDASKNDAPVSYLYSDYFIALAFHMRMILEPSKTDTGKRARGRPPQLRYDFAQNFLSSIVKGNPDDEISLQQQLFVRTKSVDSLLALMGLHSTINCYLPSNHIADADGIGFEADKNGKPKTGMDVGNVASVHCWASDILSLLDEPALSTFKREDFGWTKIGLPNALE